MKKILILTFSILFISLYAFASNDADTEKTESQVYSEKGSKLLREQNVEGAIEALEKAIELNPANNEAYKNLGIAYLWIDRRDDAVAVFKKLIEVAPDYIEGYRNLVLIYNMTGSYEEAILYGEKALELDPNDFAVMGYLTHDYLTIGEYEKAVEYSKKLIENNPDFPRAYRILAMAYDGSGDVDNARKAFEKSYNITRKTSAYKDAPEKIHDMDSLFNKMRRETLSTKGGRYLQKGELDKGIECYKKSLELNPNDFRVYYNLAKIYEVRKDTKKVISNLKKAIELNPYLLKQITDSSDFDSVKDSEEFKDMVKE